LSHSTRHGEPLSSGLGAGEGAALCKEHDIANRLELVNSFWQLHKPLNSPLNSVGQLYEHTVHLTPEPEELAHKALRVLYCPMLPETMDIRV